MFEKLFSPLQMGPIRINNRIQITPHELQYLSDGLVTETMVRYYEERAKGGAGLMEVSQLMVRGSTGLVMADWEHDSARRFPFISAPEIVPGLMELADTVHRYGAKIFMEVSAWTWAFGPVTSLPFESGAHLRELEEADILEVQRAFKNAFVHVKNAGFDGIDLHGTHGAMIEHFYSPALNRRTDGYGGSLEKRMRFVLELIEAAREVAGERMAVGMRICADEKVEGGVTPEYAAKMISILDGRLDFVNADSGAYSNYEVLNQHALQTQPLYAEQAYGLYMSEALMRVAKKTKIGIAGRITDPVIADSIIDKGQADYVGMTRALIADPELPRKATEGRLEEIRPCIGTAQDCWGRSVAHEWPMRCTVNPSVGMEAVRGVGRLGRAPTRKKVLVVGAGVAGLEAARVCAERGHEVAIYEKGGEIGGQINIAKRLPGRSDVGAIVGWYASQMRRLGVRLELRKEVTSREEARYLIETETPDVVVLAVGSSPIRDGRQMVTFSQVPGWERPNVRTVDEALTDSSVSGRVVVADSTTYIHGPGAAEFLGRRGAEVTLVTPHLHLSPELSFYNQLIHVVRRLEAAKVRIVPLSWIRRIGKATVVLFEIPTEKETEVQADLVVLNTGRLQNFAPREHFTGLVNDLREIGDCAVAGGTIHDAINSGYSVGSCI